MDLIKFINKDLILILHLNLELQEKATTSLRQGLIEFDNKKGWRGPF